MKKIRKIKISKKITKNIKQIKIIMCRIIKDKKMQNQSLNN